MDMGDIWATGAFASFESPLKDLLDSGQYTLDQLLEQDELLQELRGMHPLLVEYFGSNVVSLIQYVIKDPKSLVQDETNTEQTAEEKKGGLNEQDPNQQDSQEQAPGDAADAHMETQDATGVDDSSNWILRNTTEPIIPSPSYAVEGFTKKDLQVLRYPYVACEVICTEINSIVDAFVDGHVDERNQVHDIDENIENNVSSTTEKPPEAQTIQRGPRSILDLFFSLLYETKPGELDDYRAGYFDKILNVICRKRPQAMANYMNDETVMLPLMENMLKHLYSHSILQVVQRLLLPQPFSSDISEDNTEPWQQPQHFRSKWGEEPKALELLIQSLLGRSSLEDDLLQLYHAQNASEVLITIIQNSPLTAKSLITLTQDPYIDQIMVAASVTPEGKEFSPHDDHLTAALNVLESLVLQLGGYGSVTTAESMDQPMASGDALIQHLPTFLTNLANSLQDRVCQSWSCQMQFSLDSEQPILGTARLRMVRLLESLVLLGNPSVDELLVQSRCLSICLDLVWKFEWNSMLHQSVANLLVHVFEGANARSVLQEYFLTDCALLSRLIESFAQEENEEAAPPPPESSESDATDSCDAKPEPGTGDVLAVSDDDVDVALEQQEVSAIAATANRELEHQSPVTKSLDLSTLKDAVQTRGDAPARIPSLRKGYMGHVIIVCQALVHACNATPAGEEEDNDEVLELFASDGDLKPDNGEETKQDKVDDRPTLEKDPNKNSSLVLANIVNSHPLALQWQEFVSHTLAAETTIQSTPLGGYHASNPGPIRPDLIDFVDDFDENRGLSIGGEVIDMDDNDIEVAASMMDALNISSSPSDGDGGSADYAFDDPLGNRFDNTFGQDVLEDVGEEDEGGVVRRVAGDVDPPVMDLFAGNFELKGGSTAKEDIIVNGDGRPAEWADFAEFDSAFDDSLDVSQDNPEEVLGDGAAISVDDDIFASPPTLLLDAPDDEVDDDDEVALEDDGEIPMTSQYPSRRPGLDDDDSSVEDEEAEEKEEEKKRSQKYE